MDGFLGKWQLVESDNFDAYLKEIGVGFVLRKLAGTLKPSLEVKNEGDYWTFTSVSTFKTHPTKFKLGEETLTTTIDDREVKSTFTLEDGKLIQVEKPVKDNEKESRFERSLEDNKLVVLGESNGVKCRRVYAKA